MKQNSFSTMKRREWGKRGGKATLARHGVEYMREIGRRGAITFHKRYRFQPVNLNDFAIVRRDTGEAIAFLSGRPF